ncbi:MAG: hypothetical protein ACXVB0_13475 [Mucilaginibacter sp.]
MDHSIVLNKCYRIFDALQKSSAWYTIRYHLLTIPFVAYIILSHQFIGSAEKPGVGFSVFFMAVFADTVLVIVSGAILALQREKQLSPFIINLAVLGILVALSFQQF